MSKNVEPGQYKHLDRPGSTFFHIRVGFCTKLAYNDEAGVEAVLYTTPYFP